jgi:hypothetical protein
MAYADNRTAEIGLSWSAEQIVADLDTGVDLAGMFREEELREMLEAAANGMMPDFQPVGEDEQPRLDQKKPTTCPECGHEFVPS